ncbi:MAG: RuBisCO large subunit C-terminal-like domain-containing protein [Anaerolineae bacterium]|nr:RuBisCO large subunit C-terminal-like domain-containing protein [Anaerolineae bacterium]
MIFPPVSLTLSGDRFTVIYRLAGADEAEARAKIKGICLEQTVELPEELLPDDDIRAEVVGRLEWLHQADANIFEAAISYAVETTGFELPQLLNVMFGNTSMQPHIRVERLELPERLLQTFKGPRFGQSGLRALLQAYGRPLLCTALKPLGLPAKNLADLAGQFALGGIDLIKDDHGLANQPFHPFHERVRRCAEAVNAANQKTGYRCLYAPNITAPAQQIVERAYLAKEAGAGGLMIIPGLVGLDSLRLLAEDDGLGLPVISHPAYWGSYVTHPQQGVAHRLTYGLLPRLAGADATIFVNYGGRFSFTSADCRGIVAGASEPLGRLKPIFPIPGGGMTLARLPEMVQFYGPEVILLIAGGLYAHGPNLLESCRQFRALVDRQGVED